MEWVPVAARWSVPAPQARSAKRPAARRAAARSAELAISSRASHQDRPMPRCAVSIASATAKPCAHRWSRKREGRLPVDQVAAVDGGDVRGGVDAARGGRRVAGRPAGRRTSSGSARPGSMMRAATSGSRRPCLAEPPAVSPGARDLDAAPSSEERIASSASWTPLAPANRSQRERLAERGIPQEQLPLRLEPVVEFHVVRHVGPHRRVVERDRAGQGSTPASGWTPCAGWRSCAGPPRRCRACRPRAVRAARGG